MDHDELILFGAGMIGRKTYKKFKEIYKITAVIDNAPEKQGKVFGMAFRL